MMKYKNVHGWAMKVLTLVVITFMPLFSNSQSLEIEKKGHLFSVSINSEKGEKIHAPQEGLWSIATEWKNDWPTNWHHFCRWSID